ncbi:hypothetical protein TIFTF001_018031 [Ficus carica]|uniref:BI1-like protein n=1 Tax=Ficus carica TaxID=3494 RepID=A0AA88DBA0_FICCA|nr:hypothetical protein TIFTF001_018031 [Ficus carica]
MWNPQPYRKADIEVGATNLYPMMLENPELRWSFIRKIYSIVCIQLLATIAVAAIVVSVHPISHFFANTGAGLGLYIVLLITPFITLCPLYYYSQRHPVNYILLGIFTISLAFAVGLTCAFTNGKVILESVILTTVVVIFFPMGRISVMIYGCLASLIFCGYIIYDTDNLIKRYTYDEYIWAAVALYLDIINLFLSLLTIFRAADS